MVITVTLCKLHFLVKVLRRKKKKLALSSFYFLFQEMIYSRTIFMYQSRQNSKMFNVTSRY